MRATHEPNPLIPSFSPTGGEGARRAVEGDLQRFMAPIRVQKLDVVAIHNSCPRPPQSLQTERGVQAASPETKGRALDGSRPIGLLASKRPEGRAPSACAATAWFLTFIRGI
jgi:hypothetical protein